MRGTAITFQLRRDSRKFSNVEDRSATCRRCGARIVLLPDDRRQGYCFDCLDLLETE